MPRISSTTTMRLIVLLRDDQRYIFTFDGSTASRIELHRLCGRYAADPDLNFTWQDACQVLLKAKTLAQLD